MQTQEFGDQPCPLQPRSGPREFKAVDDRLVRHTGANGIILKNLCQNKAMPSPRRVVLASTSRYRQGLLERLGMPFECADPQIGEAPLAGEAPAATALRLAQAKARAVAIRFPDALVIGSDQVAHGKPNPELFLRAAELLAVEPKRCLVFEDAEPGFLAAQSAGMSYIDVRPYRSDLRAAAKY